MTTICEARRVGDQMFCDRCRIVWDYDDPEPPECPKKKAASGKDNPIQLFQLGEK